MRKDEDLDEIIKKVDFDENGEINYLEFVSGTLDRNLLCKENMWKVFKFLDTDNREILTYESLRKAFQRRGDYREESYVKMASEVSLEPPTILRNRSNS
jgi:Ca2+-binding EF-hand superfamily protein